MLDRLKLWFVLGVLAAGLFAIFLQRAPGQSKSSAPPPRRSRLRTIFDGAWK